MNDEQIDLPWMPIWVNDFLTSRKVAVMSAEQVGVYFLLLLSQWKDGAIPDADETLEAITKNAPLNVVRTTLERCFEERSGGWVNARLEEVRAEQLKRLERFREAGKASGKARKSMRRRHLPSTKDVRTTFEQRSKDVRTTFEQSESESESEVTTPLVGPPEGDASERVAKRRTRLPEIWKPNEGHRSRAASEGIDIERECEKFRLHHEAKGTRMLSWDRAFTTWLLNAVEFNGRGPRRQAKSGKHWALDLPDPT